MTGFLVRSRESNWSKGSLLAVDAGSHLAAITRILANDFPLVSERLSVRNAETLDSTEDDSPSPTSALPQTEDGFDESPYPRDEPPLVRALESGAFSGLPFPHASARANALHVVREHVSTYLITHPHIDHLSGFVINTAAFHNTSRPKRLAALPHTVNAIKTHIFNDIIWPNLTDEDGGVGFVTFQRLADGGNIVLGEGHGRGFIEVCDGLSVKGLRISHGHCMRGPGHVHRGSVPEGGQQMNTSAPGQSLSRDNRSLSFSLTGSQPGTPGFGGQETQTVSQCVIDSTAYFIRAESSVNPALAKEVLIFGDVEPDSISLSPRNAHVWAEAAPKIAAGLLRGVFIECSYTDSQSDATLFGHLAPRHLHAELQNLAQMVAEAKRDLEFQRRSRASSRKRKRTSNGNLIVPGTPQGTKSTHSDDDRGRRPSRRLSHVPPLATTASREIDASTQTPPHHSHDHATGRINHVKTDVPMHDAPNGDRATFADALAPSAVDLGGVITPELARQQLASDAEGPLKGLRVVVIHVKDTLTDGPLVGDTILAQLQTHEIRGREEGRPLGCDFVISRHAGSYWF